MKQNLVLHVFWSFWTIVTCISGNTGRLSAVIGNCDFRFSLILMPYWCEMSMILFFLKELIKIQKLRGQPSSGDFFLIFNIFFVIFPIFGPGRHHFWVMTSYWRHNDVTWDFFPSIAPTKVVLRLYHRILLHIDQSSFSGLWVNLPPPPTQPSNVHRIAQPQ